MCYVLCLKDSAWNRCQHILKKGCSVQLLTSSSVDLVANPVSELTNYCEKLQFSGRPTIERRSSSLEILTLLSL